MKKIIGFLPILFLIANAILVTICYQDLPDIIPSHFNIKGEVDGYGDKSTIIIPLMIHIGITLLLSWIGNHPEKHNYSVTITEENKAAQYAVVAATATAKKAAAYMAAEAKREKVKAAESKSIKDEA
jgi:uncharacterized membrane protein